MNMGFLPTPTVAEAVKQKYEQALDGDYPNGERLDKEEFARLCQCLNYLYGDEQIAEEVERFTASVPVWWERKTDEVA
jgi:hypothetical protein